MGFRINSNQGSSPNVCQKVLESNRKMNSNIVRGQNRMWRRWSATLAFAACASVSALTGCSGLVDSTTPPAKAPEQNVKNYYVKLETLKMEYQYALTSKNDFQPASDILVMDMQGRDDTDTWSNTPGIRTPVYKCNWSYVAAGQPTLWYYALDETKAVDLGVEYNNAYTDSWVELQSPISENATWTFTSKNESIAAKVTHYGITAAVGGKSYDDVVVVEYTGDKGTKGTSWFQRGVGAIFTHIERPGDILLDVQYQSMAQK